MNMQRSFIIDISFERKWGLYTVLTSIKTWPLIDLFRNYFWYMHIDITKLNDNRMINVEN